MLRVDSGWVEGSWGDTVRCLFSRSTNIMEFEDTDDVESKPKSKENLTLMI